VDLSWGSAWVQCDPFDHAEKDLASLRAFLPRSSLFGSIPALLADVMATTTSPASPTPTLMESPDTNNSASRDGDAAVNELRDMVRNQIISVLNQKLSADMRAPNGKEHLKQAIQAAITGKNPKIKVVEVYFTQFLVQS